MDEISYSLFKDFEKLENDILNRTKKLAPILELAFFLEFNQLKKIANVVLQIPLYCGTSEEELKAFREKWQLSDKDLSADIQRKIIKENQPVFDMIKEKFINRLSEMQQKTVQTDNSKN